MTHYINLNRPVFLSKRFRNPLSMRERVRVRGVGLLDMAKRPPHPAFGHLLPQGEGVGWRFGQIKTMNRSAAGFTLVELVVAIGIMAILGVIGTLSFSSWQTKTKIESQMTQMFADIAEARTNAFTQKKVYGIVFQPTGYVMKNYSSEAEYGTDANAATKGTQVRSKTLKYNITKSTAGADITNTPIVFDTKGFVYNTTNALNIFANPVTVQATNCIVISMARENVGRINGTNCEIK